MLEMSDKDPNSDISSDSSSAAICDDVIGRRFNVEVAKPLGRKGTHLKFTVIDI